jgi:transposase
MPAQEESPMARRSFTLEFKTSAARLVREQGYSVPQAAQSLGVDPRSIRDWVAKFAPLPPAAAPAAADADLRQALERLRAENKRLPRPRSKRQARPALRRQDGHGRRGLPYDVRSDTITGFVCEAGRRRFGFPTARRGWHNKAME